MTELSHVSEDGSASMVDVSAKPVVARSAQASGFVHMAPETVVLVRENGMKKGDVLTVAKIAAIAAAKKTGELIPLCHPLPLTHIAVECEAGQGGVKITASARTTAQTGVEMEALTAVSVAALTVYDMCKAVDEGMVIGEISLDSKQKAEAP